MTAFVLQQMDYVFFVHGLSLVLLAGVCSYMSRSNKTAADWEWLGAFSVLYGANQWLDLTAMSLSDDSYCQSLRFAVSTFSFLCLCEFGRRATLSSRTVVHWRWMYALLFAGVALGGLWGFDGLNATTKYLLGFVGGLWTATTLWRISKLPNQPARRSLVAAAGCFVAYAVVVGLIVPPAPFFPATHINQASFLHVVGLPVQLFRAVLAVALTACLWQYMISHRALLAETLGTRKSSLYIHGMAVGIVVVIVAGWAVTNAVAQHSTGEIQKYFLAYTQGPAAVNELIASWQQQIAVHRLVVIGAAGLVIFLLAASLLTMQSSRDTVEQIVASERLYQTVVDNLPNCLQLLDQHGRCLAINPTGLEKIGLGKTEMLGIGYLDVWPREARPVVEAAFAKALQGRRTEFEAKYLRPDGKTIAWEVVLSPVLDRDGQARRVVEIATDITDRRCAEDKLRRAQKAAEAATQAKTEFLANMSHEIRTPMTAILGYADLMLEENVGRAAQKHIEVIKRNGKHLLGVVNDILDLSKIEAGKMQIEPTRCSPVQLVAEVASLMRPQAAAKQLKLETELAQPLPETLLTDPLRMRQVLVNLVGNAIKFTDQGEVRLAVRLIQGKGTVPDQPLVGARSDENRDSPPVDENREGDSPIFVGRKSGQSPGPRLCFDVTDTGIGMSEAQIGELFQPFTQVDNSSTRKFGGTGLGLCISKRLTEALGGDIEVHSAPGKGSTFSVMIDPGPLDGIRMVRQGEGPTNRPSPIVAPVAANKIELHGRVLLAEDGLDNQRLISFFLKKAGADVTSVENGQLAVEAALAASEAGRPFDVILMDMQMPVMDGYEATRQLRERGCTGPIVALTAHSMVADRQKCLDAGCDHYATKPIDRQKLLAAVARWAGCGRTHNNAPDTTTSESNANTPMPSAFVYSHLAADPDLGELVDLFVQEMPERIDALDAQAKSRDWNQLARTAHQLKGAAGCHGFGEIVPCAARLEAAAREARQEERILSALDELLSLCRRVRSGKPQADETPLNTAVPVHRS
jgi:PAS domain S-box-containing protein